MAMFVDAVLACVKKRRFCTGPKSWNLLKSCGAVAVERLDYIAHV